MGGVRGPRAWGRGRTGARGPVSWRAGARGPVSWQAGVCGPARRRAGARGPVRRRGSALGAVLGCLLGALIGVLGAAAAVPGAPAPAPARAALHSSDSGRAGVGCGPGWVTGWMAAPQAATADPAIAGATVRLLVHPQSTGTQVRIRLSNAYGDAALVVGAASVARSAGGAAVVAGTLRPVTFDGRSRVELAPGADVLSDPVPLLAEAGRAVAVSLHLPSVPRTATVHPIALQTSYLSRRGDFTEAAGGGSFPRRITSWPVLTGVDVMLPRPTNAVLAIGDSITDGYGGRADTDQRWTDALSRRLAGRGGTATMAVLNAGLSANRLLVDDPRRFGDSPSTRFERDVAAAAGVTDVVLHAGTNDVADGRTADEITAGLRRFAERARAAGLRVFLTTITPSRTGPRAGRAAQATRTRVNAWVRGQGGRYADGVFDFAAAVADPAAPDRLAPAYDSGDGLHLSAAGYRALAGAVDPGALGGSPCLAAGAPGDAVRVSDR